MTTPLPRLLLAAVALLALGRPAPAGARPPRPHVVFFLADDLGWADVGWHGNQMRTPQLDKLAHAGARLEQFYVQPVCSPTRAAFLTGRYPMRHGLQVGVVRPWAQYGLPLKEAGYFTALVGKWHLGHHQRAYLPTRRGFDHQYGHYNGALDYFTHVRDGGFDWHRNDAVCRDEGYTTHLLAREAVRLVERHDAGKPLFLYLAFNAVHAPHQVPEKYKAPFARLKEPRRTYAGMLAAMDEAVGQVVAAIDKKGMRKDTLFLFSSDNGGPQPGKVTDNGPLRGAKATIYEGGVRVPAFATWEGRIKPGTVVEEPLHIVDFYPTLMALAGGKPGQKLSLDGKDAWATIAEGKPSPRREILINAAPNAGAIRMGDWKLVLHGLRRGEKVELFNLRDDPAEQTNLAKEQPAKVKELRTRYDELAREALPPKSRGDGRPKGFTAPKVWGEGG